jgi:hypothetical protein
MKALFKFINRAKAAILAGVSYIGSINSSAKIIKNKKVSNNYTYIVYLAPFKLSGYNVCPDSTPECRAGCLFTSGRVKIEICSNNSTIQKARIIKTKLLFEQQEFFMRWMIAEMKSYQAKAERDGYDFSARLNGTSDVDWENILVDGKNIFDHFPNVQFYDYTKSAKRMFSIIQHNYHLTFSYTGKNEAEAIQVLESNRNVAVIFNIKKGQPLPATWNGYPVIDGDITDYRPNDGNGVVVGLRWKDIGNKKNNDKIKNSCFVVQPTVAVEV